MRYLPIAEHGVIGDLHTVALVGTDGSIDWLCLPHFDSPSVFASILDAERGGSFAVRPQNPCTTKQLYFPDTNALITRFLAPDGVGEVVDFMPVEHTGEEVRRHRVIRRVSTVRGRLPYRVEVRPAFDYGRATHTTRVVDGGVVFESPLLRLALQAPTIFTVEDGAVVTEVSLAEGAPTTSLPEIVGGERNWDYRYTWIRDAAFSLFALLRLGFSEEAASFMEWLVDRFRESEHGPLQIMYGIDGRSDLAEEELTHLEGYMGSRPVRIGNDAAQQLQLDIYGELIDSVYLYNKYAEPISHDTWAGLRRVADWVCDNWDQPDEGIWETRGGRQRFTYSRLMSWVAIERAIRVARQRGLPSDGAKWFA